MAAKMNLDDYFRGNLANNEQAVNNLRERFNGISSELRNNKVCERILGKFSSFYPSVQYITLDALKNEDVPNGIEENSIYICFKIDVLNNKIEVNSCGHVWLSREEQTKTNLAMCSLKRIAIARGVKWFRRQSYKDSTDAAAKMNSFYKNVMEKVNEYTQGYPYKQGIGYVDPKENGDAV